MNKYWFKPRRYGLGAYPSTWEGWLSLAAFTLITVLASIAFPPDQRPLAFAGSIGAIVVMFVWLAWIKTDGDWRWRWGDND